MSRRGDFQFPKDCLRRLVSLHLSLCSNASHNHHGLWSLDPLILRPSCSMTYMIADHLSSSILDLASRLPNVLLQAMKIVVQTRSASQVNFLQSYTSPKTAFRAARPSRRAFGRPPRQSHMTFGILKTLGLDGVLSNGSKEVRSPVPKAGYNSTFSRSAILKLHVTMYAILQTNGSSSSALGWTKRSGCQLAPTTAPEGQELATFAGEPLPLNAPKATVGFSPRGG